MQSLVAAREVPQDAFPAPLRCASTRTPPPPPPRLPPPTIRPSRPDANGSDLAEEIRRSLENLDAIIQQHDDGGLTEEEMLNLPAPAPELLDLGDTFPSQPSPCSTTERRAPPPAPARKSSIKQPSGVEDRRDSNGHVMSEEDIGIDNSSRSVADILQKFSRASTPPKMPTVPPALRPKGAPSGPPPPPPPSMVEPLDVPPPVAFRSPDPPEPSPPVPPPDKSSKEPSRESPEREDFGFARLKKLAELSSTTGEDVHKQMTQKPSLRRAVTIDVAGREEEPSHISPLPPPAQQSPDFSQERRVSSSAVPEESAGESEAFAFSRLKALAEQSSGSQPVAGDDPYDASEAAFDNELDIDYSQVPGYIRIDSRLPNWKRTMVEKKNKEAIEAYLKAKEEEERERKKWANVPAWKRNLVQKKAAVKKDSAPAPPPPPAPEVEDPKTPSWKREWKRKSVDSSSRQ